MAVREWNDKIVFLRKVEEGATDRSYGIHVARLAGLPRPVLDRARAVLSDLEKGGGKIEASSDPAQNSLFDSASSELIRKLAALEPENMTPMQALQTLADLKREAT